MWPDFGSVPKPGQDPTGVVSVRSCEKLPRRPTEPMTAGPKMNLLLVKAKKIRDGGNAPVTIYTRKKRKVIAKM